MLGAVTIATAFGWHDLSMAANYGHTLGFFLLPFDSLLVFSAFGFALSRRMECELSAAGLAFAWQVENVPAMPWLDAVAALHVLRIMQEAIGNILAHAGASLIEVSCTRAFRNACDGVSISITDSGCGFDHTIANGGRGLSNMLARAEALNSILVCESANDGHGTRLSLWLPIAINQA